MIKLDRLLAVVLCWLVCWPVIAQVSVVVDVKGVSGDLLENVKLFLSIEQQNAQTSRS